MDEDIDYSLRVQGELSSVGMVQGYDSTYPLKNSSSSQSKKKKKSERESGSGAPEIHVQDLMSYVYSLFKCLPIHTLILSPLSITRAML